MDAGEDSASFPLLSHSPASAWLRREHSEERRILSEAENSWDEFADSLLWRAGLAASSPLATTVLEVSPMEQIHAESVRAAPPPPMSGGGRCSKVVNLDAGANLVIDVDASQGQAQQMQEMRVMEVLGSHAEAMATENVAQVSAPVQKEIGGAPTTPSNKREAPEQAGPPMVSRSHTSQEPTNSALMSMLQVMMNQKNSAQSETKQISEHLHSRAEAADQRVGEQAVETTYNRLEARIEHCEAMGPVVFADRFDVMMKNIEERDKERDKKQKVAEKAMLAAQRNFEQDLVRRLKNLGVAQKAASSAATTAQETAGRAATAAAQAWATRTIADSGGRNRYTCVFIAGFDRDTPREEIYGVAKKFVEMSSYGRGLLLNSTSVWRRRMSWGRSRTSRWPRSTEPGSRSRSSAMSGRTGRCSWAGGATLCEHP